MKENVKVFSYLDTEQVNYDPEVILASDQNI